MTGEVWERLLAEIEAFAPPPREHPVLAPTDATTLRAELEARFDFAAPVPLGELTADVARLLRTHAVHVTHPRYFGLFNPSTRPAGVVADALAAAYNPQLAAWSHAPAAIELERLVLRAFTAALGLPVNASLAHFTSGGAEANLSAVLAALAHLAPEHDADGVAGLRARPALYVTRETHHSFVKIARMAGLGTAALREVPVTADLRMDVAALRSRMAADAEAGWRPLLVVGTAGTTGAGVVDPLPALAEVASAQGAWFHVDAAWGGSAALVPRLRGALDGIERADSVTWDAHKWLSVPMGAGMFFCRHAEAVRRAFGVHTSYMPAPADGALDPYATTAQWSRRAIGLKVFMALAELGLDGYAGVVDGQARIGDALRERLRASGWAVVNETPLPVVCFTHPDVRAGRTTTRRILDTIYGRGRVWISDVALSHQPGPVLRACITSYHTTEDDLDVLLAELEHARTA